MASCRRIADNLPTKVLALACRWPLQPGPENAVQRLGSVPMKVGKDVAVDVRSNRHRDVAQALGDHLRMDAGPQHERGRAVAQVMEAERGDSCLLGNPREGAPEVSPAERCRPVGPANTSP